MQYLFGISMFLTSIFLILLILVQRGRGGGLAGAFGGMGGQSAFGTKAGDLFTRITIVVAAFWILLSVSAIKILNRSQSVFGESSSVFTEGGSDGELKSIPAGDASKSATPSGDKMKDAAATSGAVEAERKAEAPAASPAESAAPSKPESAPPANDKK